MVAPIIQMAENLHSELLFANIFYTIQGFYFWTDLGLCCAQDSVLQTFSDAEDHFISFVKKSFSCNVIVYCIEQVGACSHITLLYCRNLYYLSYLRGMDTLSGETTLSRLFLLSF